MAWPVLAALIVSGAAIVGSTAILVLGKRAERAGVWVVSFAIGTLIAGASLHLLPEAMRERPADNVMLLFVCGIVLFIIVERVVRWRHTHVHQNEERHHQEVTAEVLLLGDALHIVLGVATIYYAGNALAYGQHPPR